MTQGTVTQPPKEASLPPVCGGSGQRPAALFFWRGKDGRGGHWRAVLWAAPLSCAPSAANDCRVSGCKALADSLQNDSTLTGGLGDPRPEGLCATNSPKYVSGVNRASSPGNSAVGSFWGDFVCLE